jgi:MFS family permease
VDYLFLARGPYFSRLLLGSWIGRLPSAMAAVALPLALRREGSSYAFVGLAAGVFALAAAIGSPVAGRIVDRVGQVKVLAVTAAMSAAGFIAIAVAPGSSLVVLAGAALAGAATPPLEPCLRVLWPEIVPVDKLEGAYAIDSATQQLVFVAGPLVVVGCVTLTEPVAALWTQALLAMTGVAVFISAAPVRRWRADTQSERHWLGPLRNMALVVLLLALSGAGFAIGTLNVLVVSYTERTPFFGGAPLLLALNAGASLVGVLVYGALRWRMPLNRRLVWFACGLVVGYGLLVLIPAPVYMAVLVVLTGLFLAPLLATSFALVGRLAPEGTKAEAFAWVVTLFACGTSIGSSVVGVVLDRTDLHWAAACGASGVLGCLIVLSAGSRLLGANESIGREPAGRS